MNHLTPIPEKEITLMRQHRNGELSAAEVMREMGIPNNRYQEFYRRFYRAWKIDAIHSRK